MVVFVCDFCDFNMSLSFLKHNSKTMFHYITLLKKNQHELKYLLKLFHILAKDRIKCVLHFGIDFQNY
jgi:hypothetical protein